MVSGGIIALLFICGGLCTVLPFVAMAVFKAKNKDVKISSFFIGCGVFILFALILEQLLHTVMLPLVGKSTVKQGMSKIKITLELIRILRLC